MRHGKRTVIASGGERTEKLELSDPPWLRSSRRITALVVVGGSLAIVAWQASFVSRSNSLDDRFSNRANIRGYLADVAPRFFYFLNYTGKFPVVHLDPLEDGDFHATAAARFLEGEPRLANELNAFLRTGDHGKILLLYPSAWWRGSPREVSLVEFNFAFATLSLIALFVAFALCQHLLLGSVLTLLLGSHPYQLHSLYAANDVFGYTIVFAALCLALHAPILFARAKPSWLLAIAMVSGVLVASMREIRTEPALVGLAILATYVLAPKLDGRWRVALLATFVSAYAITGVAWSGFWQGKFDDAHRTVAAAGGQTFDGPWNRHHVLWHSLYCGLGDFGRDRGFVWDDRAAYKRAIPLMNQRFGTDYHYRAGPLNYSLDEFYTEARKHRISPETLPEYNAVIRDLFLDAVRKDPFWYGGVLLKRLHVVLSQTAPLRVAFGPWHLGIPFPGYLALVLILGAVALQRWKVLLLIAFALPASLTPLLVYSANGLAYGAAYPAMAFAIGIAGLANARKPLLSREAM